MANCLNVDHWVIEAEVNFALSVVYGNRKTEELRKKTEDTLVEIYVDSSSCKICKRLFLEEDGKTRKLFWFSELYDREINRNKALADWKPVIPPIHLLCTCDILESRYIYEGHYCPVKIFLALNTSMI